MNISDAPKKQPVPFGVNGQREDLLSTTPAGDNTASYDAGFPAVTMILKAAGGLPPKGQDMNQILYELSALARWFSAGGGNQYDSEFSTAVSGYPLGSTVLATDGSGYWISTVNANTTNPENTTAALTGWLPYSQTGVTAITGLAAANVTLSTLQAGKARITIAGTLTANINLIFPAWKRGWKVVNNCTGAFSVTCKTPSGTGVAIPTGLTASISGDGTNITQDTNILGFSGRLLNVKTFTASGAYTPTAGTASIRVKAIAAGGGGGGCPATSSSQTGGSQAGFYGQYIDVIIPISALATSVAVVIGSGGAGGAAGANQGSTGGSTSFGSIFTLGGGPGGSPGNVNSGAIVGGIGVYTGRTLTSTITPINSSNGMASATQFYQSTAGVALGYSSVQSAIEGGFYGRGGEGLYLVSSSGAAAGGTGKSGLMIIEEYA